MKDITADRSLREEKISWSQEENEINVQPGIT